MCREPYGRAPRSGKPYTRFPRHAAAAAAPLARSYPAGWLVLILRGWVGGFAARSRASASERNARPPSAALHSPTFCRRFGRRKERARMEQAKAHTQNVIRTRTHAALDPQRQIISNTHVAPPLPGESGARTMPLASTGRTPRRCTQTQECACKSPVRLCYILTRHRSRSAMRHPEAV